MPDTPRASAACETCGRPMSEHAITEDGPSCLMPTAAPDPLRAAIISIPLGGRLVVRGFYFARTGGEKVWHVVAERAGVAQCGKSAVGMMFRQDGVPSDAKLCPDCTTPMFTVLREA